MIVGYEVSTRIGDAVMPSHYKFWHTTGTVGCFGAAAAAATILGCNREQFMHALGTVGTFASGLQQAFRSQAMSKPLHAAHAADAGALAAMAAAKGVTGALDILEGEVGFGAAMSVKPDWSKATRELGTDYHITHMTFKNHGCCGHTFPSIDAVLVLKEKHKLDHKDIRKIRIATYQGGLDIVNNYEPEGDYQAKFSLPYVVAHALVHGSVRLNAFGPDKLGNPAMRALMKKIELVADPELSKAFPAPARGAGRDRDERRAPALALPGDAQRRSRAAAHRRGAERQVPRARGAGRRRARRARAARGAVATEKLPNVEFERTARQPARAG